MTALLSIIFRARHALLGTSWKTSLSALIGAILFASPHIHQHMTVNDWIAVAGCISAAIGGRVAPDAWLLHAVLDAIEQYKIQQSHGGGFSFTSPVFPVAAVFPPTPPPFQSAPTTGQAKQKESNP